MIKPMTTTMIKYLYHPPSSPANKYTSTKKNESYRVLLKVLEFVYFVSFQLTSFTQCNVLYCKLP